MTGNIFEIKRFAIHDGPGIRTTVFFKGCPLRCVWCHNPESLQIKPELAFYMHKCVNCMACVNSCPVYVHKTVDTVHVLDRELCTACGKCIDACPAEALVIYGKQMKIDYVLEKATEDALFYQSSNGGVTLSGGECLLQADFCADLLKQLKNKNIHTAVDTCGFVQKSALDKVIPYTDLFLYDIKAIDEDVHIKCTGVSNAIILENLKYLDALGKKIEIRIPYVPNFNANQISKIAEFVATLKNVTDVKVLPYHNYAGSKYRALNLPNTMPDTLPTDAEIERASSLFF